MIRHSETCRYEIFNTTKKELFIKSSKLKRRNASCDGWVDRFGKTFLKGKEGKCCLINFPSTRITVQLYMDISYTLIMQSVTINIGSKFSGI